MKLLLLLLFCCAWISGCSPIYYAPNTLNVPMIAQKGEGVIAVHVGDEGSLNVQGAYSLAPNWAVMADGFKASVDGTSSPGGGRGHLLSGGAGYYRPFARHFMWDTYGILGFGAVENHFSSSDISASFMRYGVQPSAGFRSKYFDAFAASRVLALRYFNINGTEVNEVQYLNNAGTQFLIEPALTVRGGYDFLKVQAQVGYSFNLTDSTFKQKQDLLTIGIVYNFKRK